MQTRLESLIEISLNTLSGFVIAWITSLFILPHFGFNVTLNQNTQITLIFTAVSIVRGWVWRRLFNFKTARRMRK